MKDKVNKIVIILEKEEKMEKLDLLISKGMAKGIIPAACVALLGLIVFFVLISNI